MGKKILVLSANPKDTNSLRLDQEIREIKERIRLAKYRDQFSVETAPATRVSDLQQALADHDPQIVHFCGHSVTNGLILENDAGQAQLVPASALSRLFKLFKRHVECVVLNACLSKPQADAIFEHIPTVIGMQHEIGDEAAIKFSSGFYTGLGSGRSYEEAFEFGCSSIELENIPEHLTPLLLSKPDSSKPSSSTETTYLREKTRNPELYDLLHEKIRRLENAYGIENDQARKFQLEKQLEEARNDLKKMLQP